MTIEEILNLEPEELVKLNKKELSKVVQKVSAVANKRIQRLRKSGVMSQALMNVERAGGTFKTRGKSLNQLRSEYKRVRGFMNSKSSTVRGARKIQRDIEQRLGGSMTQEQASKFWSAYSRLKEREPNFLRLYGSDQMQRFLRDEMEDENLTIDDMVNAGVEEIDRMYNEYEDSIYDLGEFFEF